MTRCAPRSCNISKYDQLTCRYRDSSAARPFYTESSRRLQTRSIMIVSRVTSSRLVLYFLLSSLLASTARCSEDLHSLFKRQSCSNWQQACDRTDGTDCIDVFCQLCSDVYPDLGPCCATSQSLAKIGCIQQILQGGLAAGTTTGQTNQAATTGLSSASSFPTAPPNNSNFGACASFQSLVTRCDSETPGFESLTPFAVQASCVCYSSSAYIGNSYDDYFGSCLEYFSSSDPQAYSSILADGPITTSPCAAQTKANVVTGTLQSSSQPSTSSHGNQGDFLTHSASPALIASTSAAGPTQPPASPSISSSQTGATGKVSALVYLTKDSVPQLSKPQTILTKHALWIFAARVAFEIFLS